MSKLELTHFSFMNQKIKTFSPTQTKKFAAEIAKKILGAPPQKGAVVLALRGDLGAGKTTFAQGFLKGLGVKEKTTSPTFIIMREFPLRHEKFSRLYHIDAYRISTEEAATLGFKKIFRDPKNIVIIEWPEIIAPLMPKNTIPIHFSHSSKKTERRLHVRHPL
jgi:tRNA threonylcarbamoyladenosine biosynthesis protein TsaE